MLPQERDYEEPEEVDVENQIFCLQKWAKGVTNPMQKEEHSVGMASREPGRCVTRRWKVREKPREAMTTSKMVDPKRKSA